MLVYVDNNCWYIYGFVTFVNKNYEVSMVFLFVDKNYEVSMVFGYFVDKHYDISMVLGILLVIKIICLWFTSICWSVFGILFIIIVIRLYGLLVIVDNNYKMSMVC